MTTFPTTTGEITAEFIDVALHDSHTIDDALHVTSVVLDPAAAGIGFMGEVGNVGLVYGGDASGAPVKVIAKFPSQSPDIRAMMHPTRIYEREHRFYREVAPISPVRTPAIYHVTCEPADVPSDERYLLLMEDLSALTIGDQVVGVGPDQARAALVGLAAHHATFWNEAHLDQADFIPVINGPLNQAGSAIYEASLPGFMAAFADSIEPALADFVASYAAMRPQILDDLEAMPHTLVHFDFRADNLFFDTDGSVVVIDWQAISKGGGAADVGYFLSQNLRTEDRRAHEDALLHAYHDTLLAHGVTGYDFDTLLADYRVGVACGWMIPVLAVGSLDFTSDRAVALWTAVIERTQQALLDHGYGR
jgi:hypothetical protein